jgi:hypothetical protein
VFFLQIADVLFFKNAIPVKKFPYYAFVVFKEEKSVNLVLMNKPIYFPDGQQLIVQNKVGPVVCAQQLIFQNLRSFVKN